MQPFFGKALEISESQIEAIPFGSDGRTTTTTFETILSYRHLAIQWIAGRAFHSPMGPELFQWEYLEMGKPNRN